MSVNLQKGQKVDLTKGNTGLKTILVGLGWDEAPRKFSLFSKHEDIDCDASALLISAQTGKLNGPEAWERIFKDSIRCEHLPGYAA